MGLQRVASIPADVARESAPRAVEGKVEVARIKAIHRGTITLDITTLSVTATIPAVVLSKSEVASLSDSWDTAGNDETIAPNRATIGASKARLALTNATTVTATRGHIQYRLINNFAVTEWQ